MSGPSFNKQIGGATVPFGRREILRSDRGILTESYTLCAATIPSQTIDGNPGQKIVQPGLILAKITSGPNAGSVGPFQAVGTQEVQTATPSAAASGGSYKYSFDGAQTAAILYNDPIATVQTKLNALLTIAAKGGVTVTGGIPSAGTATTITFSGPQGQDVSQITVDATALTGATIAMATSTQGVAGANDGRQTLTNIVGLNFTFDPWKTRYHDTVISVLYGGQVIQGWCSQMLGDGTLIVPTTATIQAMQRGGSAGLMLDLGWH